MSSPSAFAVLVLARLIARLPLPWLQAGGAMAGRLALRCSRGFFDKSAHNLRAAGLPVLPLARASAAQAGRAAAETPWVWFASDEQLRPRVRVEGLEMLQAARDLGRGVILLTPHLGSFEVAARALAFSGPITVLYKPPKGEAARALVEQGRGRPSVQLAPASAVGVRRLLRALRQGEAIGVLPDQVPTHGEGTWAPFFGHPAYTMTLPERLATLTGAHVLLAHGERLAGGRGWIVRIEPFTGLPTPAAINQAMEALIRRFPEQYYWGYNRYREPPGVPSPAPSPAP